MLKKTGFRLLCLVAMVSFLFIAQAQTEEQGWKKTITLPGGEVVCDLNGEWDYQWAGRSEHTNDAQLHYKDIVKITQQGNSFVGIRMRGAPYPISPKGTVVIEGELDKNGFKKLMYNEGSLSGQYEGKLSKDGNKIEFDKPNSFSVVLTRK